MSDNVVVNSNIVDMWQWVYANKPGYDAPTPREQRWWDLQRAAKQRH
jgi:hypothetical protein